MCSGSMAHGSSTRLVLSLLGDGSQVGLVVLGCHFQLFLGSELRSEVFILRTLTKLKQLHSRLVRLYAARVCPPVITGI